MAGEHNGFLWVRLLGVALLPLSALALIKPLRMVAPEIVGGVHCYPDRICTDDKDRLAEARILYSSAFADATRKVGTFRSVPSITFCSTRYCRDGFGLGAKAASTMGTCGIAVAPRGWRELYVAHELIHYRQAEEIGNKWNTFRDAIDM